MHARISDLFTLGGDRYRMTLHAGRDGLGNSVSWVYLAEDIHNMGFLKGGELVVTTGLFTQSGTGLREFLTALAVNNCSGVVLNVGKYLQESDLTPEILEICDHSRIPLFTMPWEVHLVDIMQDFSRALLLSSQQEDVLSASFQHAVYQSPVQDGVLRTLNRFGFQTFTGYRVVVIQNLQDPTLVTSPLNALGIRYHLFAHDNHQVLVHSVAEDAVPLQQMLDIICYCDSIRVGTGDVSPSLSDLSRSYRRARFALAAGVLWSRQQVLFDDLGLFQVLFSSTDPELLQAIRRRHLGPLEDYDEAHGSDYVDTLRTFLLSDCSMLVAATRMHAHRNTIVYRIRRVKELLGIELDDAGVKFNLLMALHIREYLLM